jgi:H+-transporting ATPase
MRLCIRVRQALAKLWAPVPWMLEAAIVLELALGRYVEAGMIAALLAFNAALGFFQEGRAQATLAALKSRLALNAVAKRDSAWKTVPATELVVGDLVKLSLGAVVAADMRLVDGSVLLDQSMLTGESVPIEAGVGFETYAGALVRHGEAVAEVTATGAHTKSGRTAELIRTAHVVSSQQKAVLRVVGNLAMVNGFLILIMLAYAWALRLPRGEIIPLVLTGVLASIPVALPATFTLAAALGAQALAKLDVLPTRLSAVDEAASIDILCSDKTDTLTQNELAVTAVRAMSGFDESHVLGPAAMASSDGGQDPVDTAIWAATSRATTNLPELIKFIPFDPVTKMSEATAADSDGATVRIVKGAFALVAGCRNVARGVYGSESTRGGGLPCLGGRGRCAWCDEAGWNHRAQRPSQIGFRRVDYGTERVRSTHGDGDRRRACDGRYCGSCRRAGWKSLSSGADPG